MCQALSRIFLLAALLSVLTSFGVAGAGQPLPVPPGKEIEQAVPLAGIAEDLWGRKVDLSRYDRGVVLLHPFSPSNCGYCFQDGDFVRTNYAETAEREGGHFFGMCLFNPQLDVYSFSKHFRDSCPVLTAPLALHQYHRDGFPFMIAFKDGKQVYNGVLSPYEEAFHSIRKKLWDEKEIRLRPTSPIQMATRFTIENNSNLAVWIVSDSDKKGFTHLQESVKRIQKRCKERNLEAWNGATVQYEGQLKDDDYKKNLSYEGVSDKFNFRHLQGRESPIQITKEKIRIGPYQFPTSKVGLTAAFPNPCNEERYVFLMIQGSQVKGQEERYWVDYTIYENGPDGKTNILLEGLFQKDGGQWKFSPSLAHGSALQKAQCENEGSCPVPVARGKDKNSHHGEAQEIPSGERSVLGDSWTLGKSSCRFPSLVVDRQGICWVTWEENGDILLAPLNKQGVAQTICVEDDASDSFNPLLACDKDNLWVFYLNNRDGFYRLYGKTFDGHRLSDEILISAKEPADVITPSVAFNDRKMALAWSEWRANFKYLKYRFIEDRSLGTIQKAKVRSIGTDDYTCAWWPSLSLDNQDNVFAAWNQHYPAILGVCAGNFKQEATVVVGINDMDNLGGYPSVVLDLQGRPWVFWESWMWDVMDGKSQKIQASSYDANKKQWTVPYTISQANLTTFNQTPKAAVDAKGMLWACWSGRKNDSDPWNIYISSYDGAKWSLPKRVSAEGENARAPSLSIGANSDMWLSWHSGRDSEMKVKVLRYQKQTVQTKQ